jgi:penicillin-binding protein 1A
VRTAGGKLLYERKPDRLGRIVEPRAVAMMNAMMQDTLLTGTARKAELPGWPAAGKTGTSQEFRDAWFIGYTGHLVAGVWLGNDDSSPTKKITGGGLPVEIWSRFMRSAHQGVPVAGLPGVSGGVMTAGFTPPWNAQSWNTQPAPLSDAEAQVQAQVQAQPRAQAQAQTQVRPESGSGIDSWLIDRIMGRR